MVSQPSPPDPYATAQAQNNQNQFASQYNSVSSNANQINPYGSVSYQAVEQVPIYTDGKVTGYAPRYQQTTTLSPDQQKLLGLETQAKYNLGQTAVTSSANLNDALSKPMDTSQWTPWQTSLGPQSVRQDQTPTDRASVEKAMMDSYNYNTDPQKKAQEAQLAARGMSPGGAGYGTYQKTAADADANAAQQAYLASGNESRANQAAYNDASTQKFNMDTTLANYYNNMRQAQAQGELRRAQPAHQRSDGPDVGLAGDGAAISAVPEFAGRRLEYRPVHLGQLQEPERGSGADQRRYLQHGRWHGQNDAHDVTGELRWVPAAAEAAIPTF